MILIINTSYSGMIELLLNGVYRAIDTDKQSLLLAPALDEFMHDENVSWADITAIGVVVGPGSFTGIRLGIAYAKGLAIGLSVPVIPINLFEIHLEKSPNAFIAIDSGRADLFVAAADIPPCTMDISDIETVQMKYEKTVGHIAANLADAMPIVLRKLNTGICEPVIPMYLRPSYAEINQCTKV